jgi:hypothetical protein
MAHPKGCALPMQQAAAARLLIGDLAEKLRARGCFGDSERKATEAVSGVPVAEHHGPAETNVR